MSLKNNPKNYQESKFVIYYLKTIKLVQINKLKTTQY
jgi:hypothetical protein